MVKRLVKIGSRKRKLRRKTTIGQAPGTVVSPVESFPTEIELIQYDRDHSTFGKIDSFSTLQRKVSRADAQLTASRLGTPSLGKPSNERVTWINLSGLQNASLIQQIGDYLSLHPLALEDVVNVHQRSKFEAYGDVLFFVVRMPIESHSFETEQISIFLCGNVVFTVQERPGDCLEPLRERITKSVGRLRGNSADYLTYAIIDTIVDGYFHVLEHYVGQLDQLTPSLTTTDDRSVPLLLHEIRGNLLGMRRVVRQQRDALHHLLMESKDAISEETQLYFRDCLDHINQLLDATDAERETCVELRELYFAMLGQRNNDVMKVLTIVSTIFIPMSFIAGLYGMNFDPSVSPYNMPELRWTYGYPAALLAMATVAGGLFAYLKSKRWLD